MKVLATIKGAILNHKQLRSEAPEHWGGGGGARATSQLPQWREYFFYKVENGIVISIHPH